MSDAIRYAWKEILRRKRRSIGAILSYFLVGAIVIIISSIAGKTRDSAQSVLWDIGAHSVAYIPRLTLQGCCIQTYATDMYDPDREGFVVNNAPSNIISDDLIEKIRQSPNVKDASPYLMFRIRSSIGKGEWLLGGIDLTRPDAYRSTVVAEKQVVEGEFLKPDDMDHIMIEPEFALTYNLAIGSDLKLGDRMYRVAAIVNPPLRPGKANIYMSLPGLRDLVKSRLEEHAENPTNAVLIESKGAKYHDKAKADVARILGQSSRITSYGCYQPGTMAMGINENTALAITVLVVLCMLLLAMRIQYSSVIQRQFDIGVLKAIGWRNRSVVIQIMAESFFYALTGGIIGVIVAFIVVSSLPDELVPGQNAGINPLIFLAGLVLPLIGGLIAGIISSVRAVHMHTADILRSI
jgi:ABC-type lipoprotein release transport system permease subunit